MARRSNPADLRRLGDMNVTIPNAALEDWLTSEQCKRAVWHITQQVHTAYVSMLPASRPERRYPEAGQHRLRKGARFAVDIAMTPQGRRYVGWVGNVALSYRPTKGQPYPRFIEYGKPSKGIPGGYQLQRAADLVTRRRLEAAARAATGGLSDVYGAPAMGLGAPGRPAPPPKRPDTPNKPQRRRK